MSLLKQEILRFLSMDYLWTSWKFKNEYAILTDKFERQREKEGMT